MNTQNQQTETLSEHVAYLKPKVMAMIQAADKLPTKEEADSSVYPTIDVSPFVRETEFTDADRQRTIEQILECVKDTGSFHICGHGIPADLVERMEDATASFYHLSREEKQQYTNVPYRSGYTGMDTSKAMSFHGKSGVSLRELFAIEDPNDVDAPEPLRALLVEYLGHLERVELLLRRMLTLGLAHAKNVTIPEDALSELEGDPCHNFRSFFYPNNPETQRFASQDRLQPHTDASAVTLLYCRSSGLEEIRNGQWMQVPPNTPETLRVHLGDMFEFFSNGLFQSCVHRVNNSSSADNQGDRYSYGYFRFALPNENIDPKTSEISPVTAVSEKPRFGPVSSRQYFVEASKAYYKVEDTNKQ